MSLKVSSKTIIGTFFVISQLVLSITAVPVHHIRHNAVGCTAPGIGRNACMKWFVCFNVRAKKGWTIGIPDSGDLVDEPEPEADPLAPGPIPIGRCLCPPATPCYLPVDLVSPDNGTGHCVVPCPELIIPKPKSTTISSW